MERPGRLYRKNLMTLEVSRAVLCLSILPSWALRSQSAGSVVLNPDQTITAIAGFQVDSKITCTLLPFPGLDPFLQVECQAGADYLHWGYTISSAALPSYSVYTATGDYVSWTAGQANWIVVANGKVLTGKFPSVGATPPPPPPPSGPVTVGTLDVNGVCQPQVPQFVLVPGTLPDQNSVIQIPGYMKSPPMANCILR